MCKALAWGEGHPSEISWNLDTVEVFRVGWGYRSALLTLVLLTDMLFLFCALPKHLWENYFWLFSRVLLAVNPSDPLPFSRNTASQRRGSVQPLLGPWWFVAAQRWWGRHPSSVVLSFDCWIMLPKSIDVLYCFMNICYYACFTFSKLDGLIAGLAYYSWCCFIDLRLENWVWKGTGVKRVKCFKKEGRS